MDTKSFAFFREDVGGWWTFHGIHVDREEAIKFIEKFKHTKDCKSIVVLELPTGHRAYEWSAE
jgi:hypothetical protein